MENKCKVVIADDEELICSLMKKIILWEELNLTLAGIAHNGSDLYEIVKSERPDIVITDICMPEIDGLELIKRVKYDDIPCKFIIVSGYRQFEYAHNALKYNVEDYILKPIDAKELNDAIRRIKNEMERFKTTDANKKTIANTQRNSKVLKKIFMSRLIWEMDESFFNVEKIEEEYGISFKKGLYQAVCFKIDITKKTENFDENFGSIQKKIINIFETRFMPVCSQILIDVETNKILMGLNYPNSESSSINIKFSDYFDYLMNIMDLFMGLSITMGIGKAYQEVKQLKQSVGEAYKAIDCRIVEGTNKIIFWNKIESSEKMYEVLENKNWIPQIKKDIEILDIGNFVYNIKRIFRLPKNPYNCLKMLEECRLVQGIFFEYYRNAAKDIDNEDFIRKQINFNMEYATNISELEKGVVEPMADAMRFLAAYLEKINKKPIRMAIHYIEKNYSSPIGLEEVAGVVDLNPVYFSNIFKKETGENFTDYLANYRMEVAKDLLKNSSKNINEIAQETGYEDSRYFSKVFKKIVGIKPTEYRKIYG